MRIPDADRIRLTAIAETDDLSPVPGFLPRPPGLIAATREDGDLIALTRTYTLTSASRIPQRSSSDSGEITR